MVTGGLGFIGQHVVRELINRGKSVRILDTNPKAAKFQGKADVWTGSVLDKNLLYNALQGVEDVFHLAAIPQLWAPDSKDFYQINVKGTQSLLEVAQHFTLRRFVYTSSESVLRSWRDHSNELIDESSPLPEEKELPGPYSRSKLLAEQSVVHAIEQGFPAIVVYPTIPIGAGDTNLTPPTRMLKDFLNGKSVAFMECSLNLIPVKAVAKGHVLAAERGSIGERYILGQENLMMSELMLLMEQQLGRKMPRRQVPYMVANITARLMELFSSFTETIPQASVEGVRLARSNMKFNCAKARNELSVPEYSISRALQETAFWLEEHGHLSR